MESSELYLLVNYHSYGKSPSLKGEPTVNGSCSIALLKYQRVTFFVWDMDRIHEYHLMGFINQVDYWILLDEMGLYSIVWGCRQSPNRDWYGQGS